MSAWPGMVITRIYNCIFLPADMKKGVVIVGFMKLNMDRQLNHESIFSGIYSVQLLCQKLGKHLMNCFLLSLVECDPFHSVLIKSSYQKNIGLTEGESFLFCCQYISNKTVVGKNVAGSLKKKHAVFPPKYKTSTFGPCQLLYAYILGGVAALGFIELMK